MNTVAVNDASESKKAVFGRAVEIYAVGNLPALAEVIAPDYVRHGSTADRDFEGLRQSILYFHQATGHPVNLAPGVKCTAIASQAILRMGQLW